MGGFIFCGRNRKVGFSPKVEYLPSSTAPEALQLPNASSRCGNTGIGITPEVLQKLFKPSVQLDGSLSRQYKDSGLGLNLAKKLVEMHGDSIGSETVN
jgi:Histidine kinase-, DNA gyrase B-, and HSP90-like ATPase